MRTTVGVIGARGGTGNLIVDRLLSNSDEYTIRCISRGGTDPHEGVQKVKGDVRDVESLRVAVRGCDCVLFCASASQGWRIPSENNNTPNMVDFLGVKNTAMACKQEKVMQLIIISGAWVSQEGGTFKCKFLYHYVNTVFGRFMYWKRRGELAAVDELQESSTKYTIVRPVGLLNGDSVPISSISIETGDNPSKLFISRNTLADILVRCIMREATYNTIFECCEREGANLPDTSWDDLLNNLKETSLGDVS